jgi:hypothetical protein
MPTRKRIKVTDVCNLLLRGFERKGNDTVLFDTEHHLVF